jgi:DNA-binding winged helix-turn-helix (wHTH) protein
MAQNDGLPLSREELISSVWSGRHPDHVATRLVDNLVYRINKKLGQTWFRALPGLGYAFAPPNRTRTRLEAEYTGEDVVVPVVSTSVSQAHSH